MIIATVYSFSCAASGHISMKDGRPGSGAHGFTDGSRIFPRSVIPFWAKSAYALSGSARSSHWVHSLAGTGAPKHTSPYRMSVCEGAAARWR